MWTGAVARLRRPLATLALLFATAGAVAQDALTVRLDAPDAVRPLLEQHVRLLREAVRTLPEQAADRVAMTRRARREVAGLLDRKSVV